MGKETVDLNISQYSQELSLKEFNIVTVMDEKVVNLVLKLYPRRFSGIFSQLLRMSVLQCTFLAVSENPQVP